MLPVRSVFLSAVEVNIIRETSRSQFRDFVGKMRGGCVAVDSSVWDLTPCRLEHSYRTVVETAVTDYQSTRRNVSEDLYIYLKKTFRTQFADKGNGTVIFWSKHQNIKSYRENVNYLVLTLLNIYVILPFVYLHLNDDRKFSRKYSFFNLCVIFRIHLPVCDIFQGAIIK